ncbi:dynein axonemal assembly factor 5-like [Amphibalanus amphitrite]|uniref:dynein axonemal assembly factor 5-like n=1 Tax=Amphibalanus amphitrite TaxID=1232801 RepID=UPI001C92673B|nr:dynein axonemal assembly factor 5-like [Amphibalanus amphitrite]
MAETKAETLDELSEKLRSQLLLIDGKPSDKLARRRTLEALLKVVEAAPVPTEAGNAPSDSPAPEPALPITEVVQCLSDPSERCRELAVSVLSAWLARLTDRRPLWPPLVAALRQRLAAPQPQPAEPSEEVRLQLVRLAGQLVDSDGAQLAPYLDHLVAILAAALADPSPDLKTAACQATGRLARSLPRHFHLQSASLVPPLLRNLAHQRWRVREPCVRALGDVVQFGDNSTVRDAVSHMAQRMFDQVPQVRLAVTEVAGRWLVELPDRYSFFAKILPLLLTSLRDGAASVSERAEQLWEEAGRQYLAENEEENRQLINYPAPPPDGYPAQYSRPPLGCRLLAQRCFCTLLPGALADLTDWVAPTRLKVAQLLHVLVLHQETAVTQHLQKLVPPLTAALGDDEQEVVHWVTRTAELLGCFVPDSALTEVVLKPITGEGASTGRQLLLLAACLRGRPQRHLVAEQVAETVSARDVCQSHEPERQRGLLAVTAALLDSGPDLPTGAVPPLFALLVTVAGHADTESETADTAAALLSRLAEVAGRSEAALLSELGPPLLQRLAEDAELWTAASSDLLTLLALLRCSASPPESVLRPSLPVLAACCRPDRPAPLRLACFSQLCRLVTVCPPAVIRPLLHSVTDDIVAPSLVWHPGRSDAAIRTAALALLLAELQVPELAAAELTADHEKLLTAVVGLLEDESRKTRLFCARAIRSLLLLTLPGSLPVQLLHNTATELLKRLDDTDGEVRLCAAGAVPALVTALGPDYCGQQWRGHVEHFAQTLFVFLDDADERLQQLAYEALLSVGRLNAAVVCEQTNVHRDKQRSPARCDQLLRALTPAGAGGQ